MVLGCSLLGLFSLVILKVRYANDIARFACVQRVLQWIGGSVSGIRILFRETRQSDCASQLHDCGGVQFGALPDRVSDLSLRRSWGDTLPSSGMVSVALLHYPF